jgi:hypothetical protein
MCLYCGHRIHDDGKCSAFVAHPGWIELCLCSIRSGDDARVIEKKLAEMAHARLERQGKAVS